MNKQAFLNAIKALEESDPEDFDMYVYGNTCGTPACVLGHYAAREDLQGTFKYIKKMSFFTEGHYIVDIGLQKGPYSPYFIGFDSPEVLEHFDITKEEAIDLFSTVGCNHARTPQQAIDYIKNFIAQKEKNNVTEL